MSFSYLQSNFKNQEGDYYVPQFVVFEDPVAPDDGKFASLTLAQRHDQKRSPSYILT